jgi:hypothetical protein
MLLKIEKPISVCKREIGVAVKLAAETETAVPPVKLRGDKVAVPRGALRHPRDSVSGRAGRREELRGTAVRRRPCAG